MCLVFSMSLIALAEDDGYTIESDEYDSENEDHQFITFYTRPGMQVDNPDSVILDDNESDATDNNQQVKLNVGLDAYIPCYIELRLKGAGAWTEFASYGPHPHNDFSLHTKGHPSRMVFDNGLGGFVNENWHFLGKGDNAEIAPGSNVYVQANDLFRARVYSNDSYKYSVETYALATEDADVRRTSPYLPVDMRTKVKEPGLDYSSWQEFTFAKPYDTALNPSSAKDRKVFGGSNGFAATTTHVFLHQFRVPYDTDVAHGKYSNPMFFKAFTY